MFSSNELRLRAPEAPASSMFLAAFCLNAAVVKTTERLAQPPPFIGDSGGALALTWAAGGPRRYPLSGLKIELHLSLQMFKRMSSLAAESAGFRITESLLLTSNFENTRKMSIRFHFNPNNKIFLHENPFKSGGVELVDCARGDDFSDPWRKLLLNVTTKTLFL